MNRKRINEYSVYRIDISKLDNIKLHCANQHYALKGGNENEL